MSMSANFHNLKTIELSPLDVPGVGTHPRLRLTDDQGNYIAVHLTDENVERLAVAVEAYRAAQDVAADEEGWIEWGGGECPVRPDAIVDVKFRDGDVELDREARFWSDWWKHMASNRIYDIVAYRIVKP